MLPNKVLDDMPLPWLSFPRGYGRFRGNEPLLCLTDNPQNARRLSCLRCRSTLALASVAAALIDSVARSGCRENMKIYWVNSHARVLILRLRWRRGCGIHGVHKQI